MEHALPLLEVRTSPEGRISGYAATFNGIDSYGDSILRGAFAASLKARHPVMLLGHRQDQVIGRWDTLREDARGLYVEGVIALKAGIGRDAFELLQQRAMNGLSIGFKVPPGGASMRSDGVRELRAIDLFEVSAVAIPADDRARVESVKSAHKPTNAVELQRALQDLGFSRRHAAAIVQRGFPAIAEVDAEEVAELHAAAALAELRAAVSSLKF